MPLPASKITRMIGDAFPGAQVELKDLAGDNDHFAVVITSEIFQGKSRVQQHQMVYDALQGKMGGELHALSIKTQIPSS